MTGNRCGHNPSQFRHCSIARRGKGGQPQLIGILSGRVQKAGYMASMLSTWQRMNSRKRRSEIREAMVAVLQYLVAEWFQIDSRSCGKREGDTLRVPDAELIAKQISKSPGWRDRPPLSTWRVRAVIKQFEKCGYFRLTRQRKFQRDTGEWESGPKLISFTKKLFLELGGKHLWERVSKAASERLSQLMQQFTVQGITDTRRALIRALRPAYIRSPRQIKHSVPPPTAAFA